MEATYLLFYVVTCIIIIIFYLLTNRKSDLPPGPWNLPLVGYLPWLDPEKPYISLTKLSEKYGPIYGLKLGHIYTIAVTDIKLIKKIQMKDEAMGRPPLFTNDLILSDKGLANLQGNFWKNQRRFVMNFLKSVGASRLSTNRTKLENEITRETLDFIEFVKKQGSAVVLCPTEVLTHSIGSISSIVILGEPRFRDDEKWRILLKSLHNIITLIGFTGPLNFLPFLKYLPTYKAKVDQTKQAINNLLETMATFIQEREKSPLGKDRNLIEAFLEERRKGDPQGFYTNIQLNYLLKEMYGASVETTVTFITWYFLYMAVYQKVQEEVRREVVQALGDEVPTLAHLPFLPYLEATLSEVARIRTVVPLAVPHSALQDIFVGGFRIPKGSMILSVMWAVHMDPKVWGDPEVFRPERFLDEDGKFQRLEAFIPFHTGKRVCVGEDMAKMTSFLFVANVMKHFRIECDDGNVVDLNGIYGVTLQPKPHKLVFSKL